MADGPELRLHLNENPYGPGRRVRAALRAAAGEAHHYPDLEPLVADLATLWTVAPAQVTVGAGGDDILRRAVDATAGAVVAPWPSFSVYPILAAARGRDFVRVPLDAGGRANPTLLAAVVRDQGRPGTLLIANPNNPTGAARARAEFLAMAAEMPAWLVVIDEAYGDFRSPAEATTGVATWPENVVVARTLSKLHALAGLRVGYAVGRGWAIAAVARVGDEMAVGTLAAAGARAALADRRRLERMRAASLGRRRQLSEALKSRGFAVAESETNFVLARPPAGVDADALVDALRVLGVRTRRGRDLGVDGALRVSVGSGPMQRRLFERLDRALAALGAGRPGGMRPA